MIKAISKLIFVGKEQQSVHEGLDTVDSILLEGIVNGIQVGDVRHVHVYLSGILLEQVTAVLWLSLLLSLTPLTRLDSLRLQRQGLLRLIDYQVDVIHFLIHEINELLVNHVQVRLNDVIVV